MLIPGRHSDGQWTQDSLLPQVLLAIFLSHGLMKALGKGVAVIFREGEDIFIHWVSAWDLVLQRRNFLCVNITWNSPWKSTSHHRQPCSLCCIDHPQRQGKAWCVWVCYHHFPSPWTWCWAQSGSCVFNKGTSGLSMALPGCGLYLWLWRKKHRATCWWQSYYDPKDANNIMKQIKYKAERRDGEIGSFGNPTHPTSVYFSYVTSKFLLLSHSELDFSYLLPKWTPQIHNDMIKFQNILSLIFNWKVGTRKENIHYGKLSRTVKIWH